MRAHVRRLAAAGGLMAAASLLAATAPSPALLGDPAATDPSDIIAAAAAVLAWFLLAWLGAGTALMAMSALPGRCGALAAAVARRTTPRLVRRAVGAALGLAVLGSSSTGALAAEQGATPAPAASASASPSTQVAPLEPPAAYDWPVAAPAGPQPEREETAPLRSPDVSSPAPPGGASQQPSVGAGLLGPPGAPATASDGTVVVRPGDSLWRIAARALGPAATDEQVADAWPRWWATNRAVVGDDPDLVLPGQRLRPPPG